MIFFWYNSAFDMVCARSSCLDHDLFRFYVIVDNPDPFFIASSTSFQKKIDCITFEMRITNIYSLFRCVRWISFNSCGTQISSFLTSSRRLMWFSIVVCDTFNCFAISRTVIWRFDSIQLRLSLCHHQLQKVDQNVGHLSVRNLRKEIFKTNSDTCVLLNN